MNVYTVECRSDIFSLIFIKTTAPLKKIAVLSIFNLVFINNRIVNVYPVDYLKLLYLDRPDMTDIFSLIFVKTTALFKILAVLSLFN